MGINLWFIIGMAVVLELVTYIIRFSFDLHSRNVQKKLKFPVRIHHMYIGVMIAIFGLFYTTPVLASSSLANLNSFWIPASISVLDIGLAIALSDVLHHFIVLPLFHQNRDFP